MVRHPKIFITDFYKKCYLICVNGEKHNLHTRKIVISLHLVSARFELVSWPCIHSMEVHIKSNKTRILPYLLSCGVKSTPLGLLTKERDYTEYRCCWILGSRLY